MTNRLQVQDGVKWMYDKVKWTRDGIKWMYDEIKWTHDGIKWMYDTHLESCVQVIATSAEKNPQQREKNIPNIHDE